MSAPIRWPSHQPNYTVYTDNVLNQPPLRPLQPSPYLTTEPPIYPQPPQTEPLWAEQQKHDIRRTRISRACDACRRKKIKCDTNGPGSTCRKCKLTKVQCTFNDSAKKRGPPKGYIEVLENRLKRMEKILDDYVEEEPNKKLKPNDDNNTDHQAVDTDVTPISPAIGALSESSAKSKESSIIISAMRTRYIGDMSPLPFLAQKIDFEDASIASQIGIKIKRYGQSLVICEEEGKRSSQIMLEKLGMLKPGETIKGLNDWIYKVAAVDKTTSDNLLKVYFAYIHPGLPVVNKHVFLKQYRGEIEEYPSAPLLNAIFGAATRYIATCHLFGDRVPDAKIDMKEGWSETFFENLLTYVKGDYSPCIATVQAIVIGQSHRASLDEKLTSGWLLNSAAIRMAQDLGLHRSSENWDIPESEKETRKRVWWSVYIMDKWSSAATGRPQTIFDEDCDEQYPSETASWEEVMDTSGKETRYPSLDQNVAQKAKSENIPIYQPFVQLVKLSEILGKILQGLYTPLAKKHSEKRGSTAIVTYLDNALSEWRAALPPALKISSINMHRLDSKGQTPLLSMSGLIYLSYCTLLILLHRPFIEKDGSQKTRSSQSSLSICTSAATRCVEIAEKMHYRDFLLCSWNFAIYPVFTASLIHIYNASNSDSIVSDVAKSNLIRATHVLKKLSKLSTAAARVYDVLLRLMKVRKISVEEDIEEAVVVKKRRKKTKKEEDIPTNEAAEVSSPMTISSDSDMIHSAQSTPSISNGDWINGLYSSFQPEPLPAVSAPSSVNSVDYEPYTIKQFGLTPSSPAIPTRESSVRQSTIIPNDIPPYVMPSSFNPTDSFLLGLSGPPYVPINTLPQQSHQHHQQNNIHLPQEMVFDDNMNYEAMLANCMFRNTPDNPFWSVPSSIELDDWTAYLLPQQQNTMQNTWNTHHWP